LRNSLHWALLLVLILVGVVFAQGAPSATPDVPGSTVPAWVFYWVLGLVSVGSIIWAAVTKVLWDRGNKASTLNENERGWLRQLYHWHKPVDDDQIPLWYIPRSWLDLLQNLREDHAAFKPLLTRLVEQHDGINADLRAQIKERLELHDRQQTKMLKLAVRVQRAVETLAGLEKPEIESALGDTDEGSS
jgi:hypothetical protein